MNVLKTFLSNANHGKVIVLGLISCITKK